MSDSWYDRFLRPHMEDVIKNMPIKTNIQSVKIVSEVEKETIILPKNRFVVEVNVMFGDADGYEAFAIESIYSKDVLLDEDEYPQFDDGEWLPLTSEDRLIEVLNVLAALSAINDSEYYYKIPGFYRIAGEDWPSDEHHSGSLYGYGVYWFDENSKKYYVKVTNVQGGVTIPDRYVHSNCNPITYYAGRFEYNKF